MSIAKCFLASLSHFVDDRKTTNCARALKREREREREKSRFLPSLLLLLLLLSRVTFKRRRNRARCFERDTSAREKMPLLLDDESAAPAEFVSIIIA